MPSYSLLLIVLIALSACTAPTKHTGKPPLGRRRPLSEATQPSPTAGQEVDTPTTGGEEIDQQRRRIGVAGTRIFHRDDCPQLGDVDRGDQVIFVSRYDALDAGYGPCEDCAPLR